jgi:hypothetical protein
MLDPPVSVAGRQESAMSGQIPVEEILWRACFHLSIRPHQAQPVPQPAASD